MRPALRAVAAAAAVAASMSPLAIAQDGKNVEVWTTSANRSALLQHAPTPLAVQREGNADIRIESKPMQTVDGFGFALTGGSAELLTKMSAGARHTLLEEMFGNGADSIHVSYLRVSIGSSDMNREVFTYDDMPQGQHDPKLEHFSMKEDADDVIPVLKEVLAINPHVQILGSPWSAPSWMKSNDAPKGGSLLRENYPVYAQYLVRYIQAMQQNGIHIDAITPQNEPLNPKNTPSMVMQPQEEADFIGSALGPAFAKAALRTRIIAYDHNCNRPDYALTVLRDPAAAKFVDGSGFHLYEGDISCMTQVHDAFPNKNLYFTEQMVIEERHDGVERPISEPVERVVIGAMRNWSRNVLLWNLAADPQFGPHTSDGGCPICQGAITLDGDHVERNIAYYVVAQIAKFVPPGSVRLDSTLPADLPNVAFRTPDGHTVLLVVNHGAAERTFSVAREKRGFQARIGAHDVATFVW